MADFAKGDFLIYTNANAEERPGVVINTVEQDGTTKAVLRLLEPNFCDDSLIGPNPTGGPTSTTVAATVDGSGVYLGLESGGTVTWDDRNGSGPTALTNMNTNTVVQLEDGTVVVGCDPSVTYGSLFQSPAPDEGRTTWVQTSDNMADCGGSPSCSKDFRDLLVCSNGDLLVAMNGEKYSTDNKKGIKKAWSEVAPGSQASFVILRDGKKTKLEATLGHVPDNLVAQWIGEHMLYSHAPARMAAKKK